MNIGVQEADIVSMEEAPSLSDAQRPWRVFGVTILKISR
jgi:hypothetical protein